MLGLIFVLNILSICSAQPSEILPETVPYCPEGQVWVNGACRGNWNGQVAAVAPSTVPDIDVQNMITVPPNCPPGQQWINGQCRDVWRGGALADSELFQKLVKDLWDKSTHVRNTRQEDDTINYYDALPEFRIEDDPSRNIISVPNQCPEGYKADALGICRKQF